MDAGREMDHINSFMVTMGYKLILGARDLSVQITGHDYLRSLGVIRRLPSLLTSSPLCRSGGDALREIFRLCSPGEPSGSPLAR
jgi:hypothetical protein